MKPLSHVLFAALVLMIPSVRAQILIDDFTSVVNGTNRFFGTWSDTNDTTTGSTNYNTGFSNSGGVLSITGSSPTPTNADSSKLELYHFSPYASIGSSSFLSVTAQALSGNAATSFKVTLLSIEQGGGSAFATFNTSSFPNGSFSTATSSLTLLSGFDPASIYSVVISGDIPGGSAAFKMSFDNISAVPEPSTYAAIFGASVFGVVTMVRRRRKA